MKNLGMSEWLPAIGSGICSTALNLAGMNSCLISIIQEPLDSTKAIPRKCIPKHCYFVFQHRMIPLAQWNLTLCFWRQANKMAFILSLYSPTDIESSGTFVYFMNGLQTSLVSHFDRL